MKRPARAAIDSEALARSIGDSGVTVVRVPGVRKPYEAYTYDDYNHFLDRVHDMEGSWAGVLVARRSA